MLYESKSEARGSVEAIWRPDGGVEGCMSSVITSMQTYYVDPRDVTLPFEKYYYHPYAEINRRSGILLL